MTDPPRLRDLPDGDAFVRGLLDTASPTRGPSPADLMRLATRVKAAGAASTVGASSVVALTTGWKALAVVGALGLGSLGVHRAARRPHAATVTAPARPHAVAETTPPTVAQTPDAPVLPTVETTAPVVESAPPTPVLPRTIVHRVRRYRVEPAPSLAHAPVAAPLTLTEEIAALDAARQQLRSNPEAALLALRNARGTQLRDERDALLVEALVRAGRREEGRAVATALTARAPHSPQSARVRALLGADP